MEKKICNHCGKEYTEPEVNTFVRDIENICDECAEAVTNKLKERKLLRKLIR